MALSWEEYVGYRRDMYEQKMYYGQPGFERGGELNTPEEWA